MGHVAFIIAGLLLAGKKNPGRNMQCYKDDTSGFVKSLTFFPPDISSTLPHNSVKGYPRLSPSSSYSYQGELKSSTLAMSLDHDLCL